jgi:hypothetical protein
LGRSERDRARSVPRSERDDGIRPIGDTVYSVFWQPLPPSRHPHPGWAVSWPREWSKTVVLQSQYHAVKRSVAFDQQTNFGTLPQPWLRLSFASIRSYTKMGRGTKSGTSGDSNFAALNARKREDRESSERLRAPAWGKLVGLPAPTGRKPDVLCMRSTSRAN